MSILFFIPLFYGKLQPSVLRLTMQYPVAAGARINGEFSWGWAWDTEGLRDHEALMLRWIWCSSRVDQDKLYLGCMSQLLLVLSAVWSDQGTRCHEVIMCCGYNSSWCRKCLEEGDITGRSLLGLCGQVTPGVSQDRDPGESGAGGDWSKIWCFYYDCQR